MRHWYMLTLVGNDRPGIVARVTSALFSAGGNLGEASMMRLGGNFTIMLMVQFEGERPALEAAVAPVAEALGLHIHLDAIEGQLHEQMEPDVRITVYGADRAGIVARVTGALAEAGLHILDLESDVGGSDDAPFYLLHIEGHAANGVEALQTALDQVARADGVEVRLRTIETLVG